MTFFNCFFRSRAAHPSYTHAYIIYSRTSGRQFFIIVFSPGKINPGHLQRTRRETRVALLSGVLIIVVQKEEFSRCTDIIFSYTLYFRNRGQDGFFVITRCKCFPSARIVNDCFSYFFMRPFSEHSYCSYESRYHRRIIDIVSTHDGESLVVN